jgi:hypothetical protein
MDNLVSLFGYSEADWNVFPFAKEYMSLILPQIEIVFSDSEKLKRFLLVGLLVQFFATNHHGDEFDTVVENWSGAQSATIQKLDVFNELYGHPIQSSEEYLDLLFEGPSMNPKGSDLLNFVLDGTKIRNRLE